VLKLADRFTDIIPLTISFKGVNERLCFFRRGFVAHTVVLGLVRVKRKEELDSREGGAAL